MGVSSGGRQTRGFRLAAVTILLIAMGIMGEAFIRAYLYFRPLRHRIDDKLGWRAAENYSYDGDAVDAAGQRYRLTYTTNENGFRLWGHLPSNRPKILVLGDSMTQAAAVSNDRTYYGRLKKSLPLEVFAYGAGGYGSLQEYLILDQYYDRIQPDVVLWEFCSNDFINNDLALERLSRSDNNGLRRPYLTDDGRIIYVIPKPFSFVRTLADHSRLLYVGMVCLDRLNATWGPTVETEIAAQGERHAGFQHALRMTDEIMRRVRARGGRSRIMAFCVDDPQPQYDALRRIVERHGIEWIEGIPQAIRAAEERGVSTRAADRGHWNETAHGICAEKILEHFGQAKIFPEERVARPAGQREP